jgi:hypothetical protein
VTVYFEENVLNQERGSNERMQKSNKEELHNFNLHVIFQEVAV